MTRLRPSVEVLAPKFLALLLHHRWQHGYFFEKCNNHVSQASVGREVLLDTEVRLPPLPEQRRIVEKVEALLERVNQAKARLDRVPLILKRFRQSVLAAACSGELTREWRERSSSAGAPAHPTAPATNDLPDEDAHLDGYEFPEAWRRVRVDQVVAIQNGRAFPSKEYLPNAGVRLLRPGNLHVRGTVEWTGDNTVSLPVKWARDFPDFVLGKGELVMNLTAQSLKDEFLGRVCLKRDDEPALLNQRIARLSPHGRHDVRPYLLLYFKSRYFRSFVNGLDAGSLIRHMHSKDVARHIVPMPPYGEQLVIVKLANELLALVEAIERRCLRAENRADMLPSAILTKAFSGELVPTEAELARAEGRTYETAEQLLSRVVGARDEPVSNGKPARRPRRRSA